jgi:hypothetical protein
VAEGCHQDRKKARDEAEQILVSRLKTLARNATLLGLWDLDPDFFSA